MPVLCGTEPAPGPQTRAFSRRAAAVLDVPRCGVRSPQPTPQLHWHSAQPCCSTPPGRPGTRARDAALLVHAVPALRSTRTQSPMKAQCSSHHIQRPSGCHGSDCCGVVRPRNPRVYSPRPRIQVSAGPETAKLARVQPSKSESAPETKQWI
eukprot:3478929-Rhodomonas_salina.1